jgi:pimeloyl-ACP methyl ester carboxylesterase
MTCFVLIPGSGGTAWYWSRVAPLLVAAGHEARPVDLPGDDETAGIREYADLVVRTAADGGDVVLVAQSMGGFTATLACEQMSVTGLTFVNAMIPVPGETAGEWWANVDAVAEREQAAEAGGYGRDFDLATYFLHDVPPDVAAEGEPFQRPEAEIAFSQPCDFTAWPAVRIRVLAGANDRFFPVAFQRRVAGQRLGVTADVLPGGHLIALSNPTGVANYLLS